MNIFKQILLYHELCTKSSMTGNSSQGMSLDRDGHNTIRNVYRIAGQGFDFTIQYEIIGKSSATVHQYTLNVSNRGGLRSITTRGYTNKSWLAKKLYKQAVSRTADRIIYDNFKLRCRL